MNPQPKPSSVAEVGKWDANENANYSNKCSRKEGSYSLGDEPGTRISQCPSMNAQHRRKSTVEDFEGGLDIDEEKLLYANYEIEKIKRSDPRRRMSESAVVNTTTIEPLSLSMGRHRLSYEDARQSFGNKFSSHGRLASRLGSTSGVYSRANSGRSLMDKSPVLPKFGDWDVNDPSSGEGFSEIFDKARNQRNAINSGWVDADDWNAPTTPQKQKYADWICCCFGFSPTK